MTVAIAGVVVAGVGVAANLYMADQAGSAAKKAGKRASASEQKRLDFEQEQWNEWQDTYGPTEDRLAAYYEALTPTLRITQGLEAFEKEKERAMTNLRETFAQRNIDRSGMSAEIDRSVAIDSAEIRAKIRADAPMEVAKEQAGFLQIGLGQDPNAGVRGALTNETNTANRNELIAARNAGQATGALVDSITDFAQLGLDTWSDKRKAANPPDKTPTVPI